MYKYLTQYSLVFLIAVISTFFLYRFGALDKIENITYDWRVKALSSIKSVEDNIKYEAIKN